MKVEAVRDDGALLVTDGPAAAIVDGDQFWITSRDSALARGAWEPATGSEQLPPDVGQRLVEPLLAFRREWESGPKIEPISPGARSAAPPDAPPSS
jgi:hypothetical protein